MAQGIYKNGEIINLTYQAAGCLAAAEPTGIVLDEAGATHSAQTTALNSALTAAGDVEDGRYHGHFTPDAEGRWTVLIADKNGAGEASKNYNVCGFNIDALGDAQVLLESGLKSGVSSSLASALVIAESGVKSAALVDRSAIVSSVKSALVVQVSDVKSAVGTVSSPASVS